MAKKGGKVLPLKAAPPRVAEPCSDKVKLRVQEQVLPVYAVAQQAGALAQQVNQRVAAECAKLDGKDARFWQLDTNTWTWLPRPEEGSPPV